MTEMVQYLKEGAAGIIALIVLLFMKPIVSAFIQELTASREERERMRTEYNEIVCNHITHNTEVLLQVGSSMSELSHWVKGGVTGPTGPPGSTGARGEKGEKGEKGEHG